MKTNYPFLTLLLAFTLLACTRQKPIVNKAFSHAEQQTTLLLEQVKKAEPGTTQTTQLPRSLTPTGELYTVASPDWTSGFFPGVLWYLYEFTGNKAWQAHAEQFTASLENEKTNGNDHDIGFKIYCSYGNGYRLTNNETYREAILTAAKTLASRYSPVVGAIRSWDHNTDKWDYPVIIDNMMNLELLFAATRLSGDSSYYNIAVNHANTTLKSHYRDDVSTFHVVDYNPSTGAIQHKNTHQGYNDESAWARGQAWGLYGYTMTYRETKDDTYMKLAERVATYLLQHPNMPSDLVPYWDFNAPDIPNTSRDASAAAIMASALYELSTFSKNGKLYKAAADKILTSLSEQYASPAGKNNGFILSHSTGSKPHNSEVDVPLIYADYYYLEALLRKQKLDSKN